MDARSLVGPAWGALSSTVPAASIGHGQIRPCAKRLHNTRSTMHDLVPTADSPLSATTPAAAAAGESRPWVIARTAFPFLVVGGLWEMVAHLDFFPPRLFPSLEIVAAALIRLTVSGILPLHAAQTLLRLFAGFALAAVVGVTLGIAMGRSRRAEDIVLPLVSILDRKS